MLPRPFATATRRAQHGLSLFVVLISLIALAFGALALVRSIDTGTLAIGNLGFKKAATAISDQVVENQAIAWLQTQVTAAGDCALPDQADDGAHGYYARSPDLDPAGNAGDASLARVDWNDDDCGGCVSAGTCSACRSPDSDAIALGDYSLRYLIARMCKDSDGDGTITSSECAIYSGSASATSQERGCIGAGANCTPKRLSGASACPYFRIIVHARGPRQTVSITETYVHF